MKSAIIISFLFHVSVYFVSSRIVRFHSVRYIPRQVYSVKLFSMEEARPQVKVEKNDKIAKPPAPAPKKPKSKNELVPPAKKQKKAPKKKQKRKTVPSTEVKKEPSQSRNDDAAEENTSGKPSTGEMSIDAEDFPFGYYLVTVRRKIAGNWDVPLAGPKEELFCKVFFRIARDGSIIDPAVESSSGSFLFDQAALRAVIQASPLPPLPGEYQDKYLGVHFSFAYEEK